MNNPISNLKQEENLLLKLCRLLFNDDQKSTINELVTGINDWDYFTKLANEHGIVSLVFYNLVQLDLTSSIPESSRNTLQALHLQSLARNTFLIEKYIELKENLDEIGIEPVVLKGMALEPSIYGNKVLRQMTDIDLYIPGKDECLKAWNHLVNYGCKPKPLKSPIYKKILADFGKHMPDLYKDGISIDLHHGLFDNDYPINTIGISTDKLKLKIPTYDIHFLFLAKHLSDHELRGESQLRLYIDLLQIIIKTELNFTSTNITNLAEKSGLKTILIEKLFLLHKFWLVPVKEDILNQLTDKQKSRATDMFLSFLRNPKGRSGTNKGTNYRKTLRNIPTLRKKFIFIIGDLFPSLTFMQNRYSTKTRIGACLYYPLRLGKLLLLLIR
ncbi:MAG: nucleotidyltransferase family protein [Bacteroidota bacterium]|nr:nucleotidyltransferase family protein [Bacteroidota bacterium]